MLKIKKGDKIVVIAGDDKGKQGVVMSVFPSQDRILVKGINLVKKHIKPDHQAMKKGEIIEKESPINVSNVKLLCPKTSKPTRVGFKIKEDGTKVRIAKISNEEL